MLLVKSLPSPSSEAPHSTSLASWIELLATLMCSQWVIHRECLRHLCESPMGNCLVRSRGLHLLSQGTLDSSQIG